MTISYTLKTNGVVRPVRSKPLEYLHGSGRLIAGLEKALEGKTPGDRFSTVVPPAEAYGERDRALQQKVPTALFGSAARLKPGMRFQAWSEDGKHIETLIVTEVNEEEQAVVLDANHPLAGMTLEFEVEVISVRDANEEKLEKRNNDASRPVHPDIS